MIAPLSAFELEFMQRAALEIVLLAAIAGVLGPQIVLRGLAFFTHGVGTATFPGLVAAGPLGVAPAAAALVVALAFAALLERFGRATRVATDAATALILVGALALGIVLASDAFESGAEVDSLLFGSLLAIGDSELLLTGVALVVVALVAARYGRTWLASGFDDPASRSLGLPVTAADRALLAAIALAVVVSLDAIGALLVGALLIVPAAIARLLTASVRSLAATTAGLALAIGLGGLWLAYELDVPPGAAIATLGGGCFALVALIAAARGRAPAEAAR